MAGGWRRKKTTWRGIVPAHVLLESVGGCDVSRTNITHVFFIQGEEKSRNVTGQLGKCSEAEWFYLLFVFRSVAEDILDL